VNDDMHPTPPTGAERRRSRQGPAAIEAGEGDSRTDASVASTPSPPEAPRIRPEHLSGVLQASPADFLVVVGHRNM